MKIEDIKHLQLTKAEIEHYKSYLGSLVVDESWAYDPKIPDQFPHRYSKALVGFTFQAAVELLKIKSRLTEKEYEDLLRRDQ